MAIEDELDQQPLLFEAPLYWSITGQVVYVAAYSSPASVYYDIEVQAIEK